MSKRSDITFSTKYIAYASEFIEEKNAKCEFLTGYNIKSSEFMEQSSASQIKMGADKKFYCKEIYDGTIRQASTAPHLTIVGLNYVSTKGSSILKDMNNIPVSQVLRPSHPSGYYGDDNGDYYYYYFELRSSSPTFRISASPANLLNGTSCRVVDMNDSIGWHLLAFMFATRSSQTTGTITITNGDGVSANRTVTVGTQSYAD